MTIFTHIRGLDMRGPLAGCVDAVMAADTIAHDIYMIEICRYPADRTVAIVAVVTTGYVSLVLACCGDAVVAGTAAAQHLRVINDGHWHERDCRMTIFTDVRRANMSRAFADCIGAVVT